MVTFTRSFAKTPMTILNLPAIIAGDGESPSSAVKFQPSLLQDRVAAEYQFICGKFGREDSDWTEKLHFTSTDMQSVWVIQLSDASQRTVYFETTGTIYDEK